jgi:hypothetical protein
VGKGEEKGLRIHVEGSCAGNGGNYQNDCGDGEHHGCG